MDAIVKVLMFAVVFTVVYFPIRAGIDKLCKLFKRKGGGGV